jgi:sporulation integral membrane protein YtvI
LGLALALTAEPVANFLQEHFQWRRNPAVFAAVTAILALLTAAGAALGTLAVRRAAALAGGLSALAGQAAEGLTTARHWCLELVALAPESLSRPLEQSVRELFENGGGLLDRAAAAVLGLAGQAAQHIPGSLVTLGTAVLASYLICQRLPALRRRLSASGAWQDRWRPALTRLFRTGRSWLKAQLKLSSVTFAIVLGGFLLLGVRQKLLMALVTALVDAVPLLGTGTILLPWTLVSLLSGEPVRAVGLLGIYVTALITRSALEPKLLGRQLGLDPLAALAALYIGYRLWGFGGMILAPILTVTARELCRSNS